nr:probable receptor-like protein kinase At2g23200 [Tanacetum cinerariifolium]
MVSSYGRSLSISIDFTRNHPSPIPNMNLNLKFQLAEIVQATNNFDEKLMIGKGGFGKVYKGTLSDGMLVAVKRGEKGHGQGQPEFVTEIMVLTKIRHHHLVSLIGLDFTPSTGSSYAFVNAIEAFTTPNDLFIDGAASTPRVSPKGPNGDMYKISTSYAFNPIHRINVGGQSINDPERDPLRRNWTPDDPFLFSNVTAKSESKTGLKPRYDVAAPYDANLYVYSTARSLRDKSVNITWNFGVSKNSMFLIRAHFCDFMSPGRMNANDAFSFFIYSHYMNVIQLGQKAYSAQVPFYADFVVDSGEFNNVSVSVGAIRNNSQTVFLNGLEIMELLTNSGGAGLQTHKKVHIVIGCVVGGMVLVLVLGFLIGSQYRKSKLVVGAKMGSHMVSSYGRSLSISIDFTRNHPSPIPNMNLN